MIEHNEEGHDGEHCEQCAHEAGSVVSIWPSKNGYPEPEIVDWNKKSDKHNHGEVGHIGYRCGQCARDATDHMVAVADHSVDYWQDKQLEWQEECDMVMSQFDTAVAEHFPVHQPAGCTTCPVKPSLPEKPNPPIERALKQILRDDKN